MNGGNDSSQIWQVTKNSLRLKPTLGVVSTEVQPVLRLVVFSSGPIDFNFPKEFKKFKMPMCRRVNVNVEARFSRVTSDPWKSSWMPRNDCVASCQGRPLVGMDFSVLTDEMLAQGKINLHMAMLAQTLAAGP